MKTRLTCPLITLALTASLLPFTTHAQLKITEVESSEAGSGKADWFELSNFGSSPVNITGYKMDDSSASFGSSVALAGLTIIAPGESVCFFEQTGSTPLTVQGFRNWWGLSASVQVGSYSGSGVGLSSGGDGVTVFDSTGAQVNLVSFGAATAGVTFGWNPNTQTFGGLSQTGLYGAYVAPQDGDVGSPGVVPEPSSLALLGLSAATLLVLRRR
jgi:hypothetical protein